MLKKKQKRKRNKYLIIFLRKKRNDESLPLNLLYFFGRNFSGSESRLMERGGLQRGELIGWRGTYTHTNTHFVPTPINVLTSLLLLNSRSQPLPLFFFLSTISGTFSSFPFLFSWLLSLAWIKVYSILSTTIFSDNFLFMIHRNNHILFLFSLSWIKITTQLLNRWMRFESKPNCFKNTYNVVHIQF